MNPYTPSSSQLFYGREKIFRTLLKNEEAGQSVVLIGGRRCGKTRLIERIQKYLQAKINKDSHSSGTMPATSLACSHRFPGYGFRILQPGTVLYRGSHCCR